jgi:hypothetical protein
MNPLQISVKAFFMAYRIWFQLAALGAILGGIWWGVHTYNAHQQKIGYDKAVGEYQIQLDKALIDKQDTEDKWRKQQEDSNVKANKRQTVLASNLATANLINSGLSSDLSNLRDSLSNPAIGANANGAATLKTVLGECTRELEGYTGKNIQLATACDRHVNDLIRYHEQWPKVDRAP